MTTPNAAVVNLCRQRRMGTSLTSSYASRRNSVASSAIVLRRTGARKKRMGTLPGRFVREATSPFPLAADSYLRGVFPSSIPAGD